MDVLERYEALRITGDRLRHLIGMMTALDAGFLNEAGREWIVEESRAVQAALDELGNVNHAS